MLLADFDEFRTQLGADAEEVPGLGDCAYFYGPDMLYVRVGSRGFSLRIYPTPRRGSRNGRSLLGRYLLPPGNRAREREPGHCWIACPITSAPGRGARAR